MNLLEQLMCAVLVLAVLAATSSLWTQFRESEVERLVAGDAAEMAKAALAYAEANASSLLALSDSSAGPEFTTQNGVPDELQAYLGFAHSGKNAWQQSYTLSYRAEPLPDGAQALLCILTTTGGVQVSQKSLKKAAGELRKALQDWGALGRMRSTMTGVIDADGQCRGGGLSFDLNRAGVPVSAGALCQITRLLDAEAWAKAHSRETLYRLAVPALPELNQMQCDLDLGAHSLHNVKSLDLRPVAAEECNEARQGSVIYEEDALRGERLLLCARTEDGYSWREIAGSTKVSLRRIQRVSEGTVVAKPVCRDGQPDLLLVPRVEQAAGSHGLRLLFPFAEEEENAWRIHVKKWENNIFENSAGSIELVTLCRAAP